METFRGDIIFPEWGNTKFGGLLKCFLRVILVNVGVNKPSPKLKGPKTFHPKFFPNLKPPSNACLVKPLQINGSKKPSPNPRLPFSLPIQTCPTFSLPFPNPLTISLSEPPRLRTFWPKNNSLGTNQNARSNNKGNNNSYPIDTPPSKLGRVIQ